METEHKNLAPQEDIPTNDASKANEALDNEPTALDPHGDVILDIRTLDSTISFLVSSKVLSLASPVFARMFAPGFAEGEKLLAGDRLRITFREDKVPAMEHILKALHYQGDTSSSMAAVDLAILAIHCDKYDCVKALATWISHWFSNLKEITNTSRDLGYMLLAAYMFSNSKQFKEVSARALQELNASFSLEWQESDLLEIIPVSILDAISSRIGRISAMLHAELQSTETLLRQHQTCHIVQNLFCTSCGRSLPLNAKKCHPCSNTELAQRYCTSETRVSDYFAIMRRCELWPSIGPFQSCSISELASRFEFTKFDTKHSCEAASRCPLQVRLEELCGRVRRIKDNMTGFCLYCAKEEGWTESDKCAHIRTE